MRTLTYEDVVSKYGYPAVLVVVENTDYEGWVCEGCGTTLNVRGEVWECGEVSMCPRCLLNPQVSTEVSVIGCEDGWLVLVVFENAEGYPIGPGHHLKEDGEYEYPVFRSRAYAEFIFELVKYRL